MNSQEVEEFLKRVVPPGYESGEHRCQLRGQLLSELEARHARAAIRPKWKTVALLLGLLCGAAAAAELVIQVHRYYFEGRASDGSYHFASEPETVYRGSYVDENGTRQEVAVGGASRTVVVREGDLDPAGIEQTRQDLEEIDALRQIDARELLSVTDTEVNGNFIGRAFAFKYVLADGRTQTLGEAGFDRPRVSEVRMEQDQQEIAQLRRRGQREVTTIIDTDLDGQIDRTLICRYTLSDGREVTVGESDQELGTPAIRLTSEQQQELSRLVSLKEGELLGSRETQMFGKTFTFQEYLFRLSDGTVVTRSEGKPQGLKTNLTDTDWKELRELRKAGASETLGTYQEEVRGKLLKFSRVRYILSDGTEVIQSDGEPDSKSR